MCFTININVPKHQITEFAEGVYLCTKKMTIVPRDANMILKGEFQKFTYEWKKDKLGLKITEKPTVQEVALNIQTYFNHLASLTSDNDNYVPFHHHHIMVQLPDLGYHVFTDFTLNEPNVGWGKIPVLVLREDVQIINYQDLVCRTFIIPKPLLVKKWLDEDEYKLYTKLYKSLKKE